MTHLELEQIKEDEGFSAVLYLCPAGYMTIGYGYNLEQFGKHGMSVEEIEIIFDEPYRISESDAEDLLANRINRINADLSDERKVGFYNAAPLEIKCVLINMAYQMGVDRLLKFHKTFQFLAAGDYQGAAAECLDSKWAREDSPERARRLSDRIASVE